MTAQALKTKNDKIELIIPHKSDKTNNSKPLPAATSKCCAVPYKRCITVTVVVLMIIIAISGTWALVITLEDKTSTRTPQALEVLGQGHKIFEKEHWGGNPPLNVTSLSDVADLVIISHTATRFCTTTAACSAMVSSIQGYHVSRHYTDIGYNFLIGGDANIYVGRGWDVVNYHNDKSISISFMGNFVYDQLTPGMVNATQELMAYGVRLGKLTENYTVVCHNQTRSTLSPGQNVYQKVKLWKHFSPAKMY